jgi:hypothetical protein
MRTRKDSTIHAEPTPFSQAGVWQKPFMIPFEGSSPMTFTAVSPEQEVH